MMEITCDNCHSQMEIDSIEENNEKVTVFLFCPECGKTGELKLENGSVHLSNFVYFRHFAYMAGS